MKGKQTERETGRGRKGERQTKRERETCPTFRDDFFQESLAFRFVCPVNDSNTTICSALATRSASGAVRKVHEHKHIHHHPHHGGQDDDLAVLHPHPSGRHADLPPRVTTGSQGGRSEEGTATSRGHAVILLKFGLQICPPVFLLPCLLHAATWMKIDTDM